MDKEFIYIFNLFKNDVYRLAYSYTGCSSDAEDITQSVFIKLYRNMEKFDETLSIKKWLIKVTINECKTLFLSKWYKVIVPLTDKEENVSKKDNEDNSLLESIMELPKKYRLVIYLYYYEEYKIKEIANILKLNENTVKTHLVRAKNLLRDILKEEIK